MEPLHQSPVLVDKAYEALVSAISCGQLAPGQWIRQTELADELGVSRQPISQALQLLKRQGLVRDHGRRGLEVTPVDLGLVRGLYAVRGALDALAARLAAERAAEGDLSQAERKALQKAVADGRKLSRGEDTAALVVADAAFHRLVYRLAGNPTIEATMEPQFPHLMRVMGMLIADWASRERSWAEHDLITREILGGRPTDAAKAARRHAEFAGEEAGARLSAPQPGAPITPLPAPVINEDVRNRA